MENKIIIYIIFLISLTGCSDSKQKSNTKKLDKDKSIEQTPDVEINKDLLMVMLDHDITLKDVTTIETFRSDLIGVWQVINNFVMNDQDTIWHRVKYANHYKTYEFVDENIFIETKHYINSDSIKILKGEFFIKNKALYTELVLAPFFDGQDSHSNEDTMRSSNFELVWINDSSIYINEWNSNSYYAKELTRNKR